MNNSSKKRKWIIYMYTFPNNKKYIGKTSRSLKERQESSEWIGYSSCTVLYKAIKKYKVENIKQDILFEGYMTDEESSRLETICIDLFKTNCCRYKNPSYGYNTTDGGEGSTGFRHTELAKEKTRIARTGKTGKDANSSKPVYCIELNKSFVSAMEAETQTNISRKSISQCVRGCSKSTLGGNTGFERLHWIYLNEMSKHKIDLVLETPRNIRKRRPVYCVELGLIFDSAEDAFKQGYGLANNIRSCCLNHKHTLKSSDGVSYHWMYADDINQQEADLIVGGLFPNNQQRSVFCIELDRYFVSIKQAEKELGISCSRISHSLRSGTSTKLNNKKLHWKYADVL